MTSSWSNLPLEILYSILNIAHYDDWGILLDNRLLLQYQSVCRSWRRPAQSVYYQYVHLRRLNGLQMSDDGLGELVKTINLSDSVCESPIMELHFSRPMELCPYVDRLLSERQDSLFYTKLLLEIHRERCLKLTEIPAFSTENEDNIKAYGYVCLALCNNLTKVSICDWPYEDPIFRYDALAQQLKDFPILDTLDITLKGCKSILEIGAFIKDCRSLTRLETHTDFNERISLMQRDIDAGPNRFSMDHVCPHIKEIIRYDMILTSNLIRYLMHAFPNLKCLEFNPDDFSDFIAEDSDSEDEDDDDDDFDGPTSKIALQIAKIKDEGIKVSTDL